MITYYPTGALIIIDYEHVKSFIKNPEDYNPIPLNSDLLKAAGFEEVEKDKWATSLLPFHLHLNEAGVFQYILFNNQQRDVISLHKLQNLYFAITNEELHIELSV